MANEKRFVCSFCARAFSRSEHRQRHERSHTNEKPFHCMYCTSAFVRRDLLQRHCRSIHKKDIQKTDKFKKETDVTDSKPEEEKCKRRKGKIKLNHGLLLFVSGKICQILGNTNDYNIIITGYVSLIEASADYPSINLKLESFIEYLQFHEINHVSQSNLCLIYAILSVGYMNSGKIDIAVEFFERSWDFLVNGLVAQYNNNHFTNPKDQSDILSIIFILAYIHLRYDFCLHNTIDVNMAMDYLNDISYIIIPDLASNQGVSKENRNLFTCIMNLLSIFLINREPPKCFMSLVENDILEMNIKNLSDSNGSTTESREIQTSLSLMVNSLNSRSCEKVIPLEQFRDLHNSLILLHKNLNKNSDNELYNIFKTNLIIQSPSKYQELLTSYIFNPSNFTEWTLLMVTLKEFNCRPKPVAIEELIVSKEPGKFNKILDAYFSSPFQIGNNLAIVSIPLIFNLQFINFPKLKMVEFTHFCIQERTILSYFIVEWYLAIVKVLLRSWNDEELKKSEILQCVLFMINHNSHEFEFNDRFFCTVFDEITHIFYRWLDLINANVLHDHFKRKLSMFIEQKIKLIIPSAVKMGSEINISKSNGPGIHLPPLISSFPKAINFPKVPLLSNNEKIRDLW